MEEFRQQLEIILAAATSEVKTLRHIQAFDQADETEKAVAFIRQYLTERGLL